MRIGGRAPYKKIPELYDAKLLAKHGIPISRLRRGLAGSMGRSANTQMVSLSYYYDPNDAEEVKRAKVINQEWAQVYTKLKYGSNS